MDHTEEKPLYIDFLFRSKRKPIKSFMGFDIGRHGFDDTHSSRVHIPPKRRIDFGHHSFRVGLGSRNIGDEQMSRVRCRPSDASQADVRAQFRASSFSFSVPQTYRCILSRHSRPACSRRGRGSLRLSSESSNDRGIAL
jgi:hypothetical protein